MIESRGKVTVETRLTDDDPQITLLITAPRSEWKKVRDDLGEYSSSPSHVSYDFYSALDNIVNAL